jgi:hypothetical protein
LSCRSTRVRIRICPLSDPEYADAHEHKPKTGNKSAGGDDLSQHREPRWVEDVPPEVVAMRKDAGRQPGDPESGGVRAVFVGGALSGHVPDKVLLDSVLGVAGGAS